MAGPWRLIVFGATGAIGAAVADGACRAGWSVVAQTRGAPPAGDTAGRDVAWLSFDPLADGPEALAGHAPFDAICFAQGANLADAVTRFDPARHLELYRANCLSVASGLATLIAAGLLSAGGARVVVVSSIWQDRARADKLSYTMTKAAVGGLVRSASVDLGAEGHLINAVLPGVLDTPMTRANLSTEQIERVGAMSPTGSLPDLTTLADTALFLCSARNRSINGQSLTVDCGMTNACLV